MTLGKRISRLRTERKYSQEYLAERMDVSRQAVSKWEKDLSSPDTKNLIRLAELFDVSVEYLATGKEMEPIEQIVIVKHDHRTLIRLLHRSSLGAFLIALAAHLIGIFTGEFTRNLIPVFPYLFYGKTTMAVVLNSCTILFTIVWIGCLVLAFSLKKKDTGTQSNKQEKTA